MRLAKIGCPLGRTCSPPSEPQGVFEIVWQRNLPDPSLGPTVYALVPLLIGWAVFARRDVARASYESRTLVWASVPE
jgi:hypothetical protein